MDKPFRSIDQQVRLLQGRRVITDDNTPIVLLREGYYAVVNGYGKAFIDERATIKAHDDRYLRGTTFADIHALFLFDRELRALTFRSIMSVEGTLRSVLSHTFCEHHRFTEAYLDRSCYTRAKGYLRGADNHAGELEWMINTLRHHANGHNASGLLDEEAPSSDPMSENARVAWYRENYDAVPLWVLFSDLTFGNLRYFYALMRQNEQVEVCKHMAEVCGTTSSGKTLAREQMLADLETLSELRNDCAHVERIYDSTFGRDDLTYLQVLDLLAAYLAEDDESLLYAGVGKLVARYRDKSERVKTALARAGF